VDGPRPAVEWVTSLPVEWHVTPPERLVLLCLACDAYKFESAPGYDAVAEWTGMRRSSCAEILSRLCEPTEHRPALVERFSVGGRRRTVWRLLADTEPSGPAGQMNRPAPPDGSDHQPSGHAGRFAEDDPPSNRPATPDGYAPQPSANRPAPPDTPLTQKQTSTPKPSDATADAVGVRPGEEPAVELDLGLPEPPPPPPRDPSPVQVLVGAYADAVRGVATERLRKIVGRNVKRLLEEEHIDPALVLAAVEEAAPRGWTDLDRVLAAPGGVSARYRDSNDARAAMSARWAAAASHRDNVAHLSVRQVAAS